MVLVYAVVFILFRCCWVALLEINQLLCRQRALTSSWIHVYFYTHASPVQKRKKIHQRHDISANPLDLNKSSYTFPPPWWKVQITSSLNFRVVLPERGINNKRAEIVGKLFTTKQENREVHLWLIASREEVYRRRERALTDVNHIEVSHVCLKWEPMWRRTTHSVSTVII